MTIGTVIAGVALVLVAWGPAFAQDLGTFRWQLAPHCNVITVDVERKGSHYELIGSDDRCGQGPPATLHGVALQLNERVVTLGMLTTGREGSASGLSATMFVSTLSGFWSDENGNGGEVQFNPVLPASGTPRYCDGGADDTEGELCDPLHCRLSPGQGRRGIQLPEVPRRRHAWPAGGRPSSR